MNAGTTPSGTYTGVYNSYYKLGPIANGYSTAPVSYYAGAISNYANKYDKTYTYIAYYYSTPTINGSTIYTKITTEVGISGLYSTPEFGDTVTTVKWRYVENIQYLYEPHYKAYRYGSGGPGPADPSSPRFSYEYYVITYYYHTYYYHYYAQIGIYDYQYYRYTYIASYIKYYGYYTSYTRLYKYYYAKYYYSYANYKTYYKYYYYASPVYSAYYAYKYYYSGPSTGTKYYYTTSYLQK